ncbi:MAG: hypothetical protein PVSMB1_04310 [Gemmatimonadaceae bacterium]
MAQLRMIVANVYEVRDLGASGEREVLVAAIHRFRERLEEAKLALRLFIEQGNSEVRDGHAAQAEQSALHALAKARAIRADLAVMQTSRELTKAEQSARSDTRIPR